MTGSANGSGASATFTTILGITVDSAGTVYVSDSISGTTALIRRITPAGVVSTLAGAGNGIADGTGTAARFYWPVGLAVDSTGLLYVSDTNNSTIRKVQ